MERRNEAKYILIYIAAICFFALGGVFVRYSQMPACNTAFYRMLFSLPLLLPFVWRELPGIAFRDVRTVFIGGMLLGGNLALWNYAMIATNVANANLLANMHIFAVVPLSYVLYKERITRPFVWGIIIAIVGMVLLVYGKADPQPGNFLGDAAAFISSLLYGGYIIATYDVRDRMSAFTVIFISAFGCLAALFPMMVILEGVYFPTTFTAIWPIFAITIIGQFGGIGLVSFCLGKLRASLCSTLSLTQPVVGTLFGLIFFNEMLTLTEICGVFVCICGVRLAQHRGQEEDSNKEVNMN